MCLAHEMNGKFGLPLDGPLDLCFLVSLVSSYKLK